MNLLSEESAISVSSKMSVPTDQNNIPLRYTGEENFAEFRANFQRYCKDHDLADLFDETLLKASPKYPEDLLIKLNSNQDLTESEDRRLSLWRNSKSKQNLLASRAIHLLKLTLSQPILDQLRSQYSSDEQAPSLAELNRLFQILQEAYGGYNFYRARRSLQALENLPVFTDSKSIKANIFKIHNLQLERVAWSNLTPAPGKLNQNDERQQRPAIASRRFSHSSWKLHLQGYVHSAYIIRKRLYASDRGTSEISKAQ